MKAIVDHVNPAGFFATIKSATAQLHKLLESNSLLAAIISPQVTLRQYGCYLTLMQHILNFYETEMVPLLTIEHRKSTLLIATDLQHLNFTLPRQVTIHPYNIEAAKITIPFAWGFGYVMEGSKLGGKVIFKNIQRNLALSESFGATFITDHGANTFVAWKEWMKKFSTYAAENNCEQQTIEAAKYAFESVYNYFELNRSLYED